MQITDIRVLFGDGTIDQLGALAKELGFSRTLLVADAGPGEGRASRSRPRVAGGGRLWRRSSSATSGRIPTPTCSKPGGVTRPGSGIDSIIGLGGGSSLDCAKGINFLLTQGGTIHDFHGYGKATKPMLPMIGVPTTAGTGSEAQSYAHHFRSADAQENGVRRSEGGVSRRHSRSAAHADAAGRR